MGAKAADTSRVTVASAVAGSALAVAASVAVAGRVVTGGEAFDAVTVGAGAARQAELRMSNSSHQPLRNQPLFKHTPGASQLPDTNCQLPVTHYPRINSHNRPGLSGISKISSPEPCRASSTA